MNAVDSGAVDIRLSTPDDFDGFYDCFAAICRERRYLALVEPPSKDEARAFIDGARQRGMVQYVAAADSRIVGWCDILPNTWEGFRHTGRLGMGIAPEFRGQRIYEGLHRRGRIIDGRVEDVIMMGLLLER